MRRLKTSQDVLWRVLRRLKTTSRPSSLYIGMGVRVLPTSAFMGMFQAGTEVVGVHYDQTTDTLFAGSMVHGQRHLPSGSVYAASERNAIARTGQ